MLMASEELAGPPLHTQPCSAMVAAESLGKALGMAKGFPSPSCFGQAWDHQELPAALPHQFFGEGGDHHREVHP